ncbi:MAG: PKD domain-containing protein, partial [Blastocatellia bacterium]
MKKAGSFAATGVAVALFLVLGTGGKSASQQHSSFEPPESEANLIKERARFYLTRHGDRRSIDPSKQLERTRLEYARRLVNFHNGKSTPQAVAGTNWLSLGPTNAAGRATAIAFDSNPQTIYLGAADGGVWKSTDNGGSWIPLTDFINDLSVGALAVAPSNPNTIYLGTGEGGYAGDFVPGIGFLKSSDAGQTWQFPSSVVATKFYRISVNPTNANELVVGTNSGAFLSTDGGSSWTSVIDTRTYKDVTDIVRDPSNPQTIYATTWDALAWCATFKCKFSSSRVLKSSDGGRTWIVKSKGIPVSTLSTRVGRMSIAISPSNPSVLYTAVGLDNGFGATEVSHIFKSTDAGDTWNDLPGLSSNPSPFISKYMNGQSWYDNTIVVSPTNENVVVAGGVYYVRTTNGGQTWELAPFMFTATTPHVDVHDLKYRGSDLFIANDGGIWTSPDDGVTSSNHNLGLVTRQYYALGIDPSHGNRTIAGAQDNGTNFRLDGGGTFWTGVIGGDGFECAFNPAVPSIAYGTVQFGTVMRTKQAGFESSPNFYDITPPYSQGEAEPFFSILRLDPANPATVYSATYRLWRSLNGGDNWQAVPTTTSDSSTWSQFATISALAISKSNNRILMVAKDPSTTGAALFLSSDGGSTWALKTSGLPKSASINNLEIDPVNPNVAYAALAGTTNPSVFKTTDGAASWGPSANGLPSFSAQVVRVDPTDSTVVYCGTDVGVYRSTDQGATWSAFGTGLPNSSVQDIQVLSDGSILRIATHGRGVWELQIPPSGNPVPLVSITSPSGPVSVNRGAGLQLTGTIGSLGGPSQTSGNWTFPDTWTTSPAGFGLTSVSHTFNISGVYPVTLAATDAHGATATATVLVTVQEAADACSTPLVIPGNGPFPYSVAFSNETASVQSSDPVPSCVGRELGGSNTVWLEFTPQTSGQYEFTTCGSAVDVVLSAWTGQRCGPYAPIANGCNHTANQGSSCYQTRTSDLVVQADAGVPLRIMVGGFTGADIGVITVNVGLFSQASGPVITNAAISGKNLIVTGLRFDSGATIILNGVDQRTLSDPLAPATALIGKKVGKKIPVGTTVT